VPKLDARCEKSAIYSQNTHFGTHALAYGVAISSPD
jgi:hypothetical protein